MGIFKKIEKRKSEKKLTNTFKLLTGYSPIMLHMKVVYMKWD